MDTAEFYGNGFVNSVIRDALRPEDDVSIVSKVGAVSDPGGPFPMRVAQRPEELRAGVEANLATLGVERIPVVNLRRMDVGFTPPIPDDQVIDLDDQLAVMPALRDEGKIGAIGLSEIAPSTLERAAAVGPVAAVQSEYSLWTRQPELGILQGCARHDAALVAFSPIARGVLSDTLPEPTELGDGDIRLRIPRFNGENWPRNLIRLQAFREYAHDNGHSPATLAIAWVLSRGPHVIALPGSRSIAHMQENALGGTITLTPQQVEEIERILPVGWAHGPRYGEELSKGPESYC